MAIYISIDFCYIDEIIRKNQFFGHRKITNLMEVYKFFLFRCPSGLGECSVGNPTGYFPLKVLIISLEVQLKQKFTIFSSKIFHNWLLWTRRIRQPYGKKLVNCTKTLGSR